MTANPLTGPQLDPVEGSAGVYRLTVPVAAYSFADSAGTTSPDDYRRPREYSAERLVTFDRDVSDHSMEEITLLTYGTPEFETLLPKRDAGGGR